MPANLLRRERRRRRRLRISAFPGAARRSRSGGVKFALGIVGALAAVGFVGSARAVSVTPDELAESRRWAAAKFEALPHQPLAEETGRTLFAAEPPFSFVYGGQPSAEWLKNRERKHTAEKLDDRRTRHTLAWTDPRTGLELRCVAIEYRNFPTVCLQSEFLQGFHVIPNANNRVGFLASQPQGFMRISFFELQRQNSHSH
mgnify:CR=1 FL=1